MAPNVNIDNVLAGLDASRLKVVFALAHEYPVTAREAAAVYLSVNWSEPLARRALDVGLTAGSMALAFDMLREDAILALDGNAYKVRQRNRFGDPLTVDHIDPRMRSSFAQARMNSALAVRNMKHELRESLPVWLRRFFPVPRKWWVSFRTGGPS